jgi:transposase
MTYDDQPFTDLELSIVKSAKPHDANTFYRLRSIRGVGKILALVMRYEIHDIDRFPRVQESVSYCRFVKCAQESAGKRYGTSGTKIGNAYLKWAFSEAAVLYLRANPVGQKVPHPLAEKVGHRAGSDACGDSRIRVTCAALPPSLALTGERSPFSHPFASDAMRALIRF